MSEGKLKTAVLGLNDAGELLLKAASKLDCFEISAVADKDTKLAEKIAAEYDCSAYDDYRQLIMEMDSRLRGNDKESSDDKKSGNDKGCLLIAAAMHRCEEYIRAGMKKKLNILKMAPAGRNFEEVAELVRLGEDANIQFAVANLGRFARSFLALREFLEQGRIEQIFLLTAFCSFGDQPYPAWQTDPKLAGGGVLLHNCYRIIDQIVWNFPTPQQVYSLSTNQAGDKQQRLYLTEDTAVVTMKFADTFMGNLTASRRAGTGPGQEYLKLYGKGKVLTVSSNKLTVSDGEGRTVEEQEYDDDELYCITGLLRNFAGSILSPDENKLCSSARENLKNMAVIDSAYLSARTAMPEEPARILQRLPRETGMSADV